MSEKYVSKYTGEQIDDLLDRVSLNMKGGESENGATFYPVVDPETRMISWENDKGLVNPPSVDLAPDMGAYTVDFTLYAASWVAQADGTYTQDVTIANHSNQTDIVEVMAADDTTKEQIKMIQKANICKAGWASNTTLTFVAYGIKPTADATLRLVITMV